MNPINGINGALPIHKAVNPSQTQSVPAEPARVGRPIDRLELSGVGHLFKALKADRDIRVDKVATIRAQIEAGTYEDDAKLDVAVDRLLDELA